jgi:hypothetical protein
MVKTHFFRHGYHVGGTVVNEVDGLREVARLTFVASSYITTKNESRCIMHAYRNCKWYFLASNCSSEAP